MRAQDSEKQWYETFWSSKPPALPSEWEQHNVSAFTCRRFASETIESDGVYPTAWEGYTIWNIPGRYRNDTPWDRTVVSPYYPSSFSMWDEHPRFSGMSSTDPRSSVMFNFDRMGELATACYNKVSDNQMNIGSELAELDETVNYIASSLEKVCQAILAIALLDYKGLAKRLGKAARRKRPSAATARRAMGRVFDQLVVQHGYKHAISIAGLWLEYRYAIGPILYSVQDAIDTYNNGLNLEANPTFTVKATRTASDPFIKDYESYGIKLNFVGKESWRMKLTLGIKDPMIHVINGFGINQGTMIIERIPFSFVWEWAINTSELISAITARNNTEYLYGYMSVAGNLKCFHTEDVNVPSYQLSASYSSRVKYYRRWVLTNSPVPTLEFRSPFVDYNGRYEFARIFDSIALAITGVSGVPKLVN